MHIFLTGVFDLFHYGHMDFLRRTRELFNGKVTITAGVHNDKESAQYKRVPILTMDERIKAVNGCKYVDNVIGDAPYVLDKEKWVTLKKKHGFDACIACIDYDSDNDPYYIGPRETGEIIYVNRTPNISTTEILERINSRC